MKFPTFPKPFPHNHPQVVNINEVIDEQKTLSQRAADKVAGFVGSWKFIIGQSIIMVIWFIINGLAWAYRWDPYPFILMNLVLSTQAAFTAPIIMMSQGRQNERDRIEAHHDYEVNVKAEEELRLIMTHLEAQDIALLEIYQLLKDKGVNITTGDSTVPSN
jgi:uncharacterized membrane protein